MPDGDFFWNACRTYTAFSNRTVYTARNAFPSCDSTTSRTPGPSPFQGFAVGAVPPNCAIPRALPMSSLTAAGKLTKSRFEDPTQCRFLVGSQDTSHLKIIPVLGYSDKCVLSAMTSRGGNRGGNRASRGVFPPLLHPVQCQTRVMRSRPDVPAACSNCNQ